MVSPTQKDPAAASHRCAYLRLRLTIFCCLMQLITVETSPSAEMRDDASASVILIGSYAPTTAATSAAIVAEPTIEAGNAATVYHTANSSAKSSRFSASSSLVSLIRNSHPVDSSYCESDVAQLGSVQSIKTRLLAFCSS